jgi:hypothetical protein
MSQHCRMPSVSWIQTEAGTSTHTNTHSPKAFRAVNLVIHQEDDKLTPVLMVHLTCGQGQRARSRSHTTNDYVGGR